VCGCVLCHLTATQKSHKQIFSGGNENENGKMGKKADSDRTDKHFET